MYIWFALLGVAALIGYAFFDLYPRYLKSLPPGQVCAFRVLWFGVEIQITPQTSYFGDCSLLMPVSDHYTDFKSSDLLRS